MNAAFLMLTTAWMAADVAAPPPVGVAPTAPPAASAPAVITGSGCSGCGGGCGATCGDPCGKPKFGERLKAMFHHHDCGCAAPAPVCAPIYHAPVCKPACEPVCKAPREHHPLFAHHHDCGCAAPAPVCAPVCDSCKPKFSLHLHGLFHHHKECGCETGCGGCGTLAPTATPQIGAPVDGPKDPMPKPKAGTTIGSIAPAAIGIQDVNSPFDLRRRYETRVSNTADYSSLTGELFFVHTDGGRWVVRYAPVSKEDRFGGSVVLARDLQMDNLSEGDLVTINGEILSEKATFPLGGALYRASKVTVVEKGSDEGKTE